MVNLNVMSTPGAIVTISKDFGNGTTRTADASGFVNFGVNSGESFSVFADGFVSQSLNLNTDTTVSLLRPFPPHYLNLGADANNAPYGVTLAGWDPQNHQGADLTDPRNAKYLVYAYLVCNKVQPVVGFVNATVEVLKSAMPSVPWVASDAETLSYGDEFVHLAPNGHGLTTGQFNTNANATEFFWGSQND